MNDSVYCSSSRVQKLDRDPNYYIISSLDENKLLIHLKHSLQLLKCVFVMLRKSSSKSDNIRQEKESILD